MKSRAKLLGVEPRHGDHWRMTTMNKGDLRLLPIIIGLALSVGVAACAGEADGDAAATGESSMAAETGEHEEGGERAEASGEESREHAEHGGEAGHDEGGEEGEEPGIYIERTDTWDMTRRGARLVLSFNAERNAFVGQVVNTTGQRLCAVRVEVHLGGGPELGPTPRTDVPAGGTIDVELATEGASFETWTAHPELSACPGW